MMEYRVKFVIKENEWFDDYQTWSAKNSSPGWAILYEDETYYYYTITEADAKKFSKKFGGKIITD